MKTHRLAFFLVAGIAAAISAHARDSLPGGKVILTCPDRSPRMSDIELAVNAGHLHASPAAHRQMLERARSVCAAGLSAVTLIGPRDASLATDSALASEGSP